MELRHLRYFAAVAAHGSFNRAARSLHLTQPALSRQVKNLEEELGVALLARATRSVTLTDAGESFYEEAREILARADHAVQRVRGEARNETLRVGYGPTWTAGIMASALERFQSVTPRVRIELCDLSPREIVELAGAGRLDLVITPVGDDSGLPGFQWTELRRMPLVLVLPATHPLARLKRIPPARLRDVPLVGLGRANFPSYLARIRALLKSFGVAVRFTTLVNDGAAPLFTAVEANHAAAILADGVSATLPPSLVARPFFPALPPVVVMVGQPAMRPSPHAESFARRLREAADRVSK